MAIENGVLKPTGVIQLRGGTAAALSAENPILACREVAVEYDTGKAKVGNGTDDWNSLPYVGECVENHEALEGLLGGKAEDRHCHITATEHRKLGIMLAALFPNGTDEMYTWRV